MRVLSQVVHTKEVEYFGNKLDVPEWVRWLATDQDGTVYGFEYEPTLMDIETKWTSYWEDDNFCEMAEVDLEGMDYKQTLVKVKRNDHFGRSETASGNDH